MLRITIALVISFTVVHCKNSDKKSTPEAETAETDTTDGGDNNNPGAQTKIVSGTLATNTGATSVVALPITGGKADAQPSSAVVSSVPASGTLAIELTDSAYLMMLKDDAGTSLTQADATPSEILDSFKGFIGIPSASESLLNVPVENAAAEIALGEIAAPDGDGIAVATTTVTEATELLGEAEEKLAEIAKTDDVIRHAKNEFANNNETTGIYYSSKPFFNWRASEKDAVTAFLTPEDMVPRGFGIYWTTNDSLVDFSKVCLPAGSTGKVTLSIYPPTGSSILQQQGGTANTEANPFTNTTLSSSTATSCGTDTMYMAKFDGGDAGLNFNIGGDGFYSPEIIPSGYWKIKAGDVEVAAFDLAVASPVDANGKPKVYIPVFKMDKDANNFVTAVTVKFYMYNSSTAAYEEVADLDVLNETISDIYFSMTDYSGVTGNTNRVVSDPIKPNEYNNTLFWTFNAVFKVPGSANGADPVAESSVVSYNSGGVSFRFDLRVASN